MNQELKIPNPEKIAETLRKARRTCQEMELARLELDEAIAFKGSVEMEGRSLLLNLNLSLIIESKVIILVDLK